jgi:hypothetical protein
MSFSVNGSNSNNPAALWQSLMSPNSSASGTSQSDPLSELLAALGQANGTSSNNTSSNNTSSNSASSSTDSAASTSGSSSPQFGPQTLQALFDLQANGSTAQSPTSQLGGDGTADATDPTSAQQAQPGEGQHAHHHHHRAGGGQNASDMFASAESATSQTTANSNGSSTTTITYADGSSVTLNTAPPSTGSSSSASATSSSGSANIAGNKYLEQLIQMQAQLVAPATSQNSVTV